MVKENGLNAERESGLVSKRQTLSQPQVKDLIYVLVKQDGENDRYRLMGIQLTDGVQGDRVAYIGTAEQINAQTGEEVIHVSRSEKVLDSLEQQETLSDEECADQLVDIFTNLREQQNPFDHEVNMYQNVEVKEIITNYTGGLNKNTRDPKYWDIMEKRLFPELSQRGYDYKRSSYADGFSISLKDKSVDQKKLQDIAEKCASKIKDIYTRMHKKDAEANGFDIYKDKEGRQTITDFVDGYGDNAGTMFDTFLKPELQKQGLTFERPSYSYFTEKFTDSGVRFRILPLQQQKRV